MEISNFIDTFQFLYGTIKMLKSQIDELTEGTFQFLYGTIKITICRFGCGELKYVSIPIWYD